MNGLLEYLLLHHFGNLFLALVIIICTIKIVRKLGTLQHSPHQTMLTRRKQESPIEMNLSDETFEDALFLPAYTETMQEPTVEPESTKETEKIGTLLTRAVRGERK